MENSISITVIHKDNRDYIVGNRIVIVKITSTHYPFTGQQAYVISHQSVYREVKALLLFTEIKRCLKSSVYACFSDLEVF